MFSSLTIKNYKSIDEVSFALKKMNLFVGPNSSGKSSTIHALLLGIDNLSSRLGKKNIRSTFAPVFSFRESRNFINNARSYGISIDECNLSFEPKDDALINTVVQTLASCNKDIEHIKNNVLYLPANRFAELAETKVNPDMDENALGMHGEYVIDYFQQHKDEKLPDAVVVDSSNVTFAGQLNYWLKKLTGFTIKVSFEDSKYTVRFLDMWSKEIHPSNVGTGVSFITSVLIVCLAKAVEGGGVVIENPEIHLHPAAQAAIVDFFARMTNANVQLFIETHSDHIFNGIRRQLHKHELLIDNVNVFSFRIEKNGTTSTTAVKLSQEGGVLEYEPGLFEQFDKDLDVILE